jgi:hypothetical protein
MEPIIPRDERDLIKLDEKAERWIDKVPVLNSYATLVVLIVLDLLAYGFVAQNTWLRFPLLILHGSVLLLALHVSRVKPRTFLIAVGSVLALFIAGLIGFTWGGPLAHTLVALAGGLLLAIPPFAILRRMQALIAKRGVTLEAVWAAVSVYLLIGSVYAYVYGIVAWVSHNPFFVQTTNPAAVDYLYFSFVTQTTVGYGDFTAAESLGRMLAVSEALIGQLYLVTVIALLVSNLGPAQRRRRAAEGGAASGVTAEAVGVKPTEE